MKTMCTSFETEEAVAIEFTAQKRAVDCRIVFKSRAADETEEETVFWLNAREAKAVGQALIAIAEASLTKGIKHE